MDHAEVRAWLEEAFFRPGALRRLEEEAAGHGLAGEDGETPGIRQHLRDCAACMHELRSLRATSVALDFGLGAPPAAQERTLAKVRQLGRERSPAAGPTVAPAPGPTEAPAAAPSGPAGQPTALPVRRRLRALRWAAALLVVLLAFVSGALLGSSWPGQEAPAGPRLELAAAMMSELLSERDARSIPLIDRANSPAGLVVYSASRQQLAVLSSTLERPAAGRYECYLERDGERTLIGPMHFQDDTAFWAGPVGGPPEAGRSGDRFLVMLEGDSQVVLWGQF